jgi:hypothetical protein
MRLNDAGLHQRQPKAVYPDHRPTPWRTEDAAPRSFEPIVRSQVLRTAIAQNTTADTSPATRKNGASRSAPCRPVATENPKKPKAPIPRPKLEQSTSERRFRKKKTSGAATKAVRPIVNGAVIANQKSPDERKLSSARAGSQRAATASPTAMRRVALCVTEI